MPSLLAEDSLLVINAGIEHSIQVYMHQVLEVLVIAACQRVQGLVRICHGIQKRVQGSLHQFHKRILHWELPGAAEHGMFQDMGHSGGIPGRCPEPYIEHFVLIIIGNQRHPCTCLLMPAQVSHTAQVHALLLLQHLISCQIFYPHFFSPFLFIRANLENLHSLHTSRHAGKADTNNP